MTKEKKAELTVAVLTYNRKEYLERALDAILAQSMPDFAVWVCDNASDDGTKELIESKYLDRGVIYHRHQINIGNIENYNFVFDHCRTEYLMITHDDDEMKPCMVEESINALNRDPDTILVSCDVDIIDEKGFLIDESFYRKKYGINGELRYGKFDFINDYIWGKNLISCPTVMFRTETIRGNGLKFQSGVGPAADTYLWMQLNTLPGNMVFLPRNNYRYRIHSTQDSQLRSLEILFDLYLPVRRLLSAEGLTPAIAIWKSKFVSDVMRLAIRCISADRYSLEFRNRILSMIETGSFRGLRLWLILASKSLMFARISYRIRRFILRRLVKSGATS